MQEQIISLETAKLAKKLGYNISSHPIYTEKYGLCELGEETLAVKEPFEIIYDVNGEFGEGERFYAPTQSLLQKWLRDNYNIHIWILPWKAEQTYCGYVTSKLHVDLIFDKATSDGGVYERVLEQALYQALIFLRNNETKYGN